MSVLIDALKQSFAKLHFIAGLVMFAFIALMVVENDMIKRTFLLLPVIIFYALSRVLFSVDQANMVQDMIERQKKRS